MSFYQTTLFKLKKFTCSFGFAALFFFLLSTVSFSYNFVVCSRHPFGSLVKFKLWNLTIFKNSIVVLWLSGKSSMFVFVFAKKLTCISLAIMLIPWLSRNTRHAYALDVFSLVVLILNLYSQHTQICMYHLFTKSVVVVSYSSCSCIELLE